MSSQQEKNSLLFSLFHHLHKLAVHLFMKTEGVGFVRVCIWSHAQMWVDFPAASSTNHYQMFRAAHRKYSREFDSVRFKVASPLQLMKATNWNPQTQCKRHLASKLSSNILENWTERLRRSSKMEKEANKEEKKTFVLLPTALRWSFEEQLLNV